MRRIDAVPDRNVLVKCMRDDWLGRNTDLIEFAGILDSLEGGFSLFLDAEWGSGKTFFVKQLICLLEESNPFIGSPGDLSDLMAEDAPLTRFSSLDGYLPVYYNAWENDHWDDPLPSLAAAIALQGDMSASFRSDTEASEKIAGSLDAILGIFGRSGISTLREAFTGKDLIEAYRERESLRLSVSRLVDSVLPEKANTLLLLIDELDRCRPSFAMRVLEQLKNLFVDERVVVVYSVNSAQLSHVVEGMYGQGFDGQRYLSRFYDLSVPLRKVDASKHLQVSGLLKTSNRFDVIAYDLTEAYSMTMRDTNRYLTELLRVRPQVIESRNGFGNDWISAFADAGLAPVMLALKTVDPDSYKSVTQQFDIQTLYDTFALSDSAMDFMDATWGSYIKFEEGTQPSDEDKRAARMKLLEALVYRIWCNDSNNPKYQHSYRVIGSSWGFDSLPQLATII